MKRVIVLVALTFLSVGMGLIVTAQNSSEAICAALVEAAFRSLTTTCTGKAGNSACIGFGDVEATFDEAAEEADFNLAGDVTDLTHMTGIHTGIFDLENEAWGIAALNVQANIPVALALQEPGLSVLMFGDVTLENRVLPEDAFQIGDGVTATALLTANVRSAPNTNSPIIVTLNVGAEMTGDALSPDGQWLRVVTDDDQVGWISTQLVAFDATTLPLLTGDSRTSMQSFILRMGEANATCSTGESTLPPPLLVIQGPNTMTSLIEINGEEIAISSTVALRILPGNIMQLFVLSGSARVGGVTIPAGFAISVQLNEDGTAIDGLWSFLRPINPEERLFFTPLEILDADIYHYYAFRLPTEAEIQALLAAVNTIPRTATPQAPRSDILSGPAGPLGGPANVVGVGLPATVQSSTSTPAPGLTVTPAPTFVPGTPLPGP